MSKHWIIHNGRLVLAETTYEGWNKNSLYVGKPLLHNGKKP